MSDLKVQGRIIYIGETTVVRGKSDTSPEFSKREFAIETEDVSNSGQVFKNTVALQFTNKQTPILDNMRAGDQVEVSFNVRSNRNDRDGVVRFFTNLTAYAIKSIGQRQTAPPQAPVQSQPYGQQQMAQQQASNQGQPDGSDLPF